MITTNTQQLDPTAQRVYSYFPHAINCELKVTRLCSRSHEFCLNFKFDNQVGAYIFRWKLHSEKVTSQQRGNWNRIALPCMLMCAYVCVGSNVGLSVPNTPIESFKPGALYFFFLPLAFCLVFSSGFLLINCYPIHIAAHACQLVVTLSI